MHKESLAAGLPAGARAVRGRQAFRCIASAGSSCTLRIATAN